MGKTKKDNKYDREFVAKKPTKPIAKKQNRKSSRGSKNYEDDDELMDMQGLDDMSFMQNDLYDEDDE